MIGSVVVWFLTTAGSAACRILTICTFPRPDEDDGRQWDYQLTVFFFLGFPLRLMGLGVFLAMIVLFCDWRRRERESMLNAPGE